MLEAGSNTLNVKLATFRDGVKVWLHLP